MGIARVVLTALSAPYIFTRKNKTLNVDKIKHEFIVLVLPIKSVFHH